MRTAQTLLGEHAWILRSRRTLFVAAVVVVLLSWRALTAGPSLPPESAIGTAGGLRLPAASGEAEDPSSLLAPLPLYATLTEGLHVTPYDQRLAAALGLQVRDALQCQEASSAGTLGWSIAQWQEAVGAAAAYRARRAATLAALTAIPIDRPAQWFDTMPAMMACGGRDPDARPHRAALMRYGGRADGGKWLCSMAELRAPCTIYSLGSWGDIDFEEAISSNTPCETFTFDCTVPPERMPKALPPRTFFEPVCIGEDKADGSFQSLTTIAKRLGHSKVHLLKMDIEGYEYRVLEGLLADTMGEGSEGQGLDYLPLQISFELHTRSAMLQAAGLNDPPGDPPPEGWYNSGGLSAGDMQVFWTQLTDLGYVVAAREDNAGFQGGAEFTVVRAFC